MDDFYLDHNLDNLKEKINSLVSDEFMIECQVATAFKNSVRDGKCDRPKLKSLLGKISVPKNNLPPIVNCASFCDESMEKPPR